MTKRPSIRAGCLAAAILVFAAVAAPVATAGAATLKIRSSAFRPLGHDSEYTRYPGAIGVDSKGPEIARFVAPLKLPAGARITGVRFYYTAGNPGDVYVKVGYIDPADAQTDLVIIGAASSAGTTGEAAPALEELGAMNVNVLARRRFAVYANTQPSGFLWEVRVSYVKP